MCVLFEDGTGETPANSTPRPVLQPDYPDECDQRGHQHLQAPVGAVAPLSTDGRTAGYSTIGTRIFEECLRGAFEVFIYAHEVNRSSHS